MIPSFPRVRSPLLLVLAILATGIRAGELDDLEKNATGKSGGSDGKTQEPYPDKGTGTARTPECAAPDTSTSFLGLLIEAIFSSSGSDTRVQHRSIGGDLDTGTGIIARTVRRAAVLDDDAPEGVQGNSRVDGDPDLSEFRLDLQGAGLDPSIRGSQLRFVFGYGPIAVEPDWLELAQRGPGLPKLDRFTIQGLFRVSPSRKIEVDLGIGGTVLAGDNTSTGWTASLPVAVSPARWCSIRWTPTVSFLGGDVLSDEEISLWWTHRYVSAFGGWRWISAGNAQIDGPTVGISLSY